jgi:hypothetical protein
LLYASEWDDAAAAKRYFGLYRTLLGKKWKRLEIKSESDALVTGLGDDGYFALQVTGSVVTSLEGAENPVEPVR